MKGGTVQITWHDTKPVLTLDFHPVTRLLATGGADHDIKLWLILHGSEGNMPSVSYQNCLSYHGLAVNILRFSPSGELLVSGGDGGEIVLWRGLKTDGCDTWKVLRTLSFHRRDVLDLQWSADGAYLVSGSVDNSCIIWDIDKGSVVQILDAHHHYVQGVAWDPLGQYVASLSSDRSCCIYLNKPKKIKGHEKINYVCQTVLTKSEFQLQDDSKNQPSTSKHLFHDETLPSFFRRLAWSPDGSFLVAPAGNLKISPDVTSNTAYIISRKDLSRPSLHLPGASKPIVAVRFCPILFGLRRTSSDSFRLPYRIVFAVATLNSLYVYDTESEPPIAILAGLHYAAITDIAWSTDAKYLALSSQDGYCTILEFESDELGLPISMPGTTGKDRDTEIVSMEIDTQHNSMISEAVHGTPCTVDASESEMKACAQASQENAVDLQENVTATLSNPTIPPYDMNPSAQCEFSSEATEKNITSKASESSILDAGEPAGPTQVRTIKANEKAKRRITPVAIDNP